MRIQPLSIFVLLLALVPFLGVFFPRSMAFAPGVCGLLGAVFYKVQIGQWPKMRKEFFLIAAGVCALGALSSLWALDPDYALERSGKMALVLFPGALLLSLALCLPEEARGFFRRVFPVCLLLAGFISAVDHYTPGFFWLMSFEQKENFFNFSVLNRGVMVLVLSSMAGFYALYQRNDKFMAALLIGLLGAILFKTDSQTAHFGVAILVLFLLAFPARQSLAWPVIGGLVVALAALAPWIVQIAFKNFAEASLQYEWLNQAFAAERLEIWDFVAAKALSSPWLGHGIEATRHVESFKDEVLYTHHSHVLHPHNFVIQIWMEFGALGIACFSALAVYILKKIEGQEDVFYRRFCLGFFMCWLGVAAISYGLWQSWWLGLMTLSAACVMLLKPTESKN